MTVQFLKAAQLETRLWYRNLRPRENIIEKTAQGYIFSFYYSGNNKKNTDNTLCCGSSSMQKTTDGLRETQSMDFFFFFYIGRYVCIYIYHRLGRTIAPLKLRNLTGSVRKDWKKFKSNAKV